jgi:Leucine-rich repeat (LRR) protein
MLWDRKWITSFDDAEQRPCAVKHLRLWNVDVAKQGDRFSKFSNLHSLDIRWSRSIELPSDIGLLKDLRYLCLLNVPLVYFPSWIFELVELRHLTVRGTEINHIPAEIAQLVNLRYLELGNSNLVSLPVELSRLRKLRDLYASDNLLTTIPDALAGVPHLKRIGMVNNRFSDQEKARLHALYDRSVPFRQREIWC